MKTVLLASITTLALSACGTIYTVKEAAKAGSNQGIYYYLPRNVVKVTIPVKSFERIEGRFASHADPGVCFHKNDIPDKANIPIAKKYSISNPTFEVLAKQDKLKHFFVDMTPSLNPFVSRGGSFTFGQQQILSGATAKGSDTTYDFAIGLATASAKGFAAGGVPATQKATTCDSNSDAGKAKAALDSIQQKLDTFHAAVRSSVTPKMYKLMKADLLNREAQLKGYFFGENKVKKFNATVYIEPDDNWKTSKTIDLFTDKFKPTTNLTLIGKHTYTVNTGAIVPQVSKFKLTLDITADKTGKFKTGKGFAYRLPGVANFMVSEGNKIKGQQQLTIAQLGSVASLPNRFGWINSEITEFTLDPLTGGIKTLKVNGSGLNSDQATALKDYTSAKKAPDSPAEDTTIADLTKQRDILLLLQEITSLEAGTQVEPE